MGLNLSVLSNKVLVVFGVGCVVGIIGVVGDVFVVVCVVCLVGVEVCF